jgi:hypothetical protein
MTFVRAIFKMLSPERKEFFFSSREYTWRVDYFGSDLSHLFPRFPIISNPDPIFSFY